MHSVWTSGEIGQSDLFLGSFPSYVLENRITASRIEIVTPAPAGSTRGNRVTAERWAGFLQQLGHSVTVSDIYRNEPIDLLIALHAGRSADSIRHYRELHPINPLLVAVTGTDIYGSEFDVFEVNQSLLLANQIIVLQPRTADDLPPDLRPKIRVIYQSALPPSERGAVRSDRFEVAVVGHLRRVKDPFRAAEAARLLPSESKIHILHLGEAFTQDLAEHAQVEMAINPRYEWLGDLPHEQAISLMARCRLVVLTSLSEGGPATIAEAIVSGIPVIATRFLRSPTVFAKVIPPRADRLLSLQTYPGIRLTYQPATNQGWCFVARAQRFTD